MKWNTLAALWFLGLFCLTGCGHSPESSSPLNKVKQQLNEVQLSAEAVRSSGLEVVTVVQKSTQTDLNTLGEIKADENHVYHINTPVAGRLMKDNVFLGDVVKAGQVLATVQNLEVAKIHAQFIHDMHQNAIDIKQAATRLTLAQKSFTREQNLLQEGISPKKDYLQAEADVAISQAQLDGLKEHATHLRSEAQAMLGVYGNQLGSIDSEHVQSASPLKTPYAGVITKKTVTVGDQVEPTEILYEVTDLNPVWLDISIYPQDVDKIRVGEEIRFVSDALPGQFFTGKINYLQPATQESSQAFVARAFLPNPQLLLKPGMLGQTVVQLHLVQTHPFLPERAIQRLGSGAFVFVDLGQGRFRRQSILLGDRIADGYMVKQGIGAGERVVGHGSFTLKAQMLKGQLDKEEE